ncbi:MAG TPA: hypothetical protein VGP07_14235 [Polyangia bacterium]
MLDLAEARLRLDARTPVLGALAKLDAEVKDYTLRPLSKLSNLEAVAKVAEKLGA